MNKVNFADTQNRDVNNTGGWMERGKGDQKKVDDKTCEKDMADDRGDEERKTGAGKCGY